MAFRPPWEGFGSGRPIKCRFDQISSSQEKLLADEKAWSENLNQGPHPMLNVPSRVLEDVKNAYIRTQVQAQPPQQAGHGSPSKITGATSGSTMQEFSISSSSGNEATDDEGDESQVSWPPTQEDARARNHFDADAMPQETAEMVGSELFRPQPETLSSPKHRAEMNNPPSFHNPSLTSSAAQSDGLELEEPGILSQVIEKPVNRAALRSIANTPPSAQLPSPIRQRGTEETQQSDDGPVPTVQAGVAACASDQLMGKFVGNEAHLIGSPSNPSLDSLKSQFALGRPTEALEPASASTSVPRHGYSSFTPSWEGRCKGQRHVATNISKPTNASENPASATANTRPPTAAQRTVAIELSLPSIHSPCSAQDYSNMLRPYDLFKATYPEYDATRLQFVSACLDVNQLRRDRALPEFLYDDYVRAHTEYIIYVTQCSTKRRPKILRGIEWYNHEITDPLYNNKVLRRDNLNDVLEAHAEDVRAVKRLLGQPQPTDLNSESEVGDDYMIDVADHDYIEHVLHESTQIPGGNEAEVCPSYHVASPGSQYMRRPAELVLVEDSASDDRIEDKRTALDPQNEGLVDGPISRGLGGSEGCLTQITAMRDSFGRPNSSAVALENGRERDRSPDVKSHRSASARRHLVFHSSSRGHHNSLGSGGFLQPEFSLPAGSSRASITVTAAHLLPNTLTAPMTKPQDISVAEDDDEKAVKAANPPVPSRRQHSHDLTTQSWPMQPQKSSLRKPARRAAGDQGLEEEDDAFEPPQLPSSTTKVQNTVTPEVDQGPTKTFKRSFNLSSTAPIVRKLESTPTKLARLQQSRTRPRRACSVIDTGPGRSPASSETSYVGAPRSARRQRESREERSRKFKAFLAKKIAAGQLEPGKASSNEKQRARAID